MKVFAISLFATSMVSMLKDLIQIFLGVNKIHTFLTTNNGYIFYGTIIIGRQSNIKYIFLKFFLLKIQSILKQFCKKETI